MTPSEAARILESLANGVDPETGEIFSADNPLNNTQVIRALFLGAKVLALGSGEIKKQSSNRKANRINPDGMELAWQPWTTEEEERLKDAFLGGVPIDELAIRHKRKVGGIRSRLLRLGLLPQTIVGG
jgi:hypothetical protein